MALTGEPNADLLAVRGQTFLQSGDFSKAITDFDHVLEMNPDDTPARIDRAIAAIGARNYQAAIGDLDQAWHAIPTHSRILFIRARAKKLSGDAAGAKKDLETAMSLTPQDEESWLSHGMAHLNAGRPREALADFERVLADNPRSIEARLNKVAVLADHLQRLDDAIAILDEVLREVPENLAALAGRGVYLARLGRRDAAHADAKAVIARNPPPIYHYQIAGVYALTSKTHPADAEEAMTWLAKALQNGVGLEYVDSDPDLLPVKLSSKFRLLIAAARTLQQHHPSNENRE
jgi:tetratricopeptide (TPR) repeat protein